jgi:hypothetical protein
MTNRCLNKWLIEALRRAKPIFYELWFPAYSVHYYVLSDKLLEVIKHLPLCDPKTTQEAIAIYDIIEEEARALHDHEVQLTFENPKHRELMKLLYPPNPDEEEDEEFWEKYDEEEEDPDPWEEEEEDEDWEVEEWDIPEEDEVLAWWCEDPECKTVIVCTKHSIDCHPEEDP